jgi:hypothetical protein
MYDVYETVGTVSLIPACYSLHLIEPQKPDKIQNHMLRAMRVLESAGVLRRVRYENYSRNPGVVEPGGRPASVHHMVAVLFLNIASSLGFVALTRYSASDLRVCKATLHVPHYLARHRSLTVLDNVLVRAIVLAR